ncbi:MAG TPA: protein kinase [Vicinamibacterales bacterium]|nr:protein kinase [Vicinamibacterales bacterium]
MTRFVDPDVTHFVDPDVTHFVDPDVTRLSEGSAPPPSNDSEETRFVEAAPPKAPTSRPQPGARSSARNSDDTGPLEVGQAFGHRYHIIRVLGIGGMGAVYHAWDAELGMAVALKVIRPESTADPAAAREMERRFKQELVLARQVTHKNVVRIHDLGEIDGIKYITMPYLEGSDLATVLREHGKMSVPAALGIIRDVADGLTAAHEQGIVHRDLKPANIMVLKDRAVIMDFGIARSNQLPTDKAAHLAPGEAIDSLKSAQAKTLVGTILGTVQYMAPEQAKGLHVDQRADIYALGLIFLDMLLGKRHSHAASAIEELKARIDQPFPLAQTLDPTIPKPIEQVIAKCLEPDREKRFQTSAELVGALKQLDENGQLIPIKRVVRLPIVAAVIAGLLAITLGVLWYQRQFIPPPVHEPISLIISDLQNKTKDPALDHTLEPMLRRALMVAPFITAYDRNTLGGIGERPPERLDEGTARQIAMKQGVRVVLAGAIEPDGNGYKISVKALPARATDVIASAEGRAAGKNQVIEVATGLMTRIREALGDDTSQSDQRLGMETLSATSLDVARYYAAALEAAANSNFAEAEKNAAAAVKLDPNFGIGYLVLASSSRSQGKLDEDRKYRDEALTHLGGLTERERRSVRGYSYWATGDYQQCVKEYGELVAKFPSDIGGHNQLALCYSHLRKMTEAVKMMQEVVAILPKRALFRHNLALYAAYSSQFQRAEKEARTIEEPDIFATVALAFAQLGQGQLAQAKQSYATLEGSTERRGRSIAASGLGDIATLEGRFSEAVQILKRGADADLLDKNAEFAASKLVAAAYAELARGQKRAAIEASQQALMHSTSVKIRFLAARTLIEAGAPERAQRQIASLSGELYPEPRALAKVLEGLIALNKSDPRRAMTVLREANELFDTWIGQFELGRASLAAGATTQADSAFDVCLNPRQGEALSLFVDEEPTYAYIAPAYYYLGMVREQGQDKRFAESYAAYLKLRGNSTEDALLKDVKKRMAR